jgi:hypothetical protein
MEMDEMIADARAEETTREYARQCARQTNMITIDLEEYMYLRDNNQKYCMLMDSITKSLRITLDKRNLVLGENNIIDFLMFFYPNEYARILKVLQGKEGDKE